jgi:Flp pilus assembly protein TadG
MNVLTGITPAKGERKMTNIAKTQDTAVVSEEPTKKATVRAQKLRGASAKGKSGKKATATKKSPKAPKVATRSRSGVREGSKTAKILDLLKRPGGATLRELMKATGWQPHSVRGFLSGTVGKKMGLTVASEKREDGERSYSVTN